MKNCFKRAKETVDESVLINRSEKRILTKHFFRLCFLVIFKKKFNCENYTYTLRMNLVLIVVINLMFISSIQNSDYPTAYSDINSKCNLL